MDARRLADLEHENLLATFGASVANARGGLLRRDRGVLLMAIPLPLRLFNEVLIEEPDADVEAFIAAIGTMRARTDPWCVSLREGIDDRWIPVVRDLGLAALGPEPWMPGMAAHPLPAAGSVPVPDELEIRRVADLDGIRTHNETAAAGFGMPREWLDAILGAGTLADPAAAAYVGYADGEPVTTGLGYRSGNTIGVYNIATVEPARRRGYGAAMTMRVIDDGAATGCDVAILQASDMGLPIYERLGFRMVVTYRAWIDPAARTPRRGEA